MAFNNKITGYQQNSKTIFAQVYDASNNIMTLTNYQGYFYLQSMIPGSSIALTKVATMDTSSMTFELTPADTSLAAGDYTYEIVIDASALDKRISVVKDRYSLLDSIKY